MEFGDQDLRTVLARALRNVIIAALLLSPVLGFLWGWRSMLLFLVGAIIAATGILEWRQLMSAVLVRLDPAGSASGAVRPLGPVLLWFFLRLVAAAALLYVSLRSLHGKPAALLIGLALALLSLLIEALRLFRGWSA
jgi:hypothetical protein